MGSYFSKLPDKKETRLLMLGLDPAGKKDILIGLKKLNRQVTAIQADKTASFNVETFLCGDVKFKVWDIGGEETTQPLWRHYYKGTHGLVFVVDIQNQERIMEAKAKLDGVLIDAELAGCSLLVFADGQGPPDLEAIARAKKMLGLFEIQNRLWHIEPSIAASGEGLLEGLDWLFKNIKKR